ncbi:Brp/Blh family beta-carotene 15,15'-dioxygenase [Sphingomonas sp. S1-29]|uniref:Brp/Blh family beta-carotene 15,15'-dioxygenase n=1 Tax=Sphingomonas sp. S1-29 TaxID=2991074 RepID=UPI0022408638|nr:Brp/Blh family beta-carotene 15,15'-dioxygenase [Sphingomonas sp. S1-29]UZK68096.1 Brp/Blh family beta-carotene 15,15'-dioxygenase [Sphingomonas sp. S1-29]
MASALGAALLAGIRLDTPIASLAAAIVFLLGGLPHGAFDLAVARRFARSGSASYAHSAALYALVLGVAATAWTLAPHVALPIFLVLAALHFAADWSMVGERFVETGVGVALVALPIAAHPIAVGDIFAAMGGVDAAAIIGRGGMMIAPVATLVAMIGVAILIERDRWGDAAQLGGSVVAMLVLPPLWGFALYFTCVHSVRHLREIGEALPGASRAMWLRTGAGLTLAALAIGYALLPAMRHVAAPGFVPAAFVLLAILFMPHLVLSARIEALRRLAA